MEATPDPTPVEIREQCLRIQEGWSVETERLRGLWAYEWEPVELRRVSKLAAAERLGTEILDEEAFMRLLADPTTGSGS